MLSLQELPSVDMVVCCHSVTCSSLSVSFDVWLLYGACAVAVLLCCSAGVWSEVAIPISSLALTYQGQLVERRLEFQADKVISVGVAVSAAMSEASSSSSSNSGLAEGDEAAAGGDADSSSGGSSSSGSIGLSEESSSTVGQEVTSAAQPHELFRLLLRDIRVEGEV